MLEIKTVPNKDGDITSVQMRFEGSLIEFAEEAALVATELAERLNEALPGLGIHMLKGVIDIVEEGRAEA